MNILSIYASHDGCVTYIKDNKIQFHTQIDRYNRMKRWAFPVKKLLDELEKIEIDKIIFSNSKSHALPLWYDFLYESKILREVEKIEYFEQHHHLFHAYCSLTWDKNIKNILVCDGTGTKYKNFYERESLYSFNKELKHVTTERNKIGIKYENFTGLHFWHPLECGKTMAWSLWDDRPKQIQINYENEMNDLLKKWKLKDELLFTGGCAQNVLYNSKLLNKFNNVFCDPFNGDFGLSLGAANFYLNNKIKNDEIYLGIPQDLNTDIFFKHRINNVTPDEVAKVVLNEPVAIFQSRSEQGQRGL